MSDKEVCRYLELVDRRLFIIIHSGIDWKPGYISEMEDIDKELAELRVLVEKAHRQRRITKQ
mgnify:CR=1 FL=1